MTKLIPVTIEQVNGKDKTPYADVLHVDNIINIQEESGKGKVEYKNPVTGRSLTYTTTETKQEILDLHNSPDVALSGQADSAALTTAAAAIATIAITDDNIASTSKLVGSIAGYDGTLVTDGVPVLVYIKATGNGTAEAKILNAGANALDGVVTVNYRIVG